MAKAVSVQRADAIVAWAYPPLTAINKMFGWHQDAAGPNCEAA